MKTLDDSFIKILEHLEKNEQTTCDLLTRKFGFKLEDMNYLKSCDYIGSNDTLTNRVFWLSGGGKNYLANYRAFKEAETKEDERYLKNEEREERKWQLTKKQAIWGIVGIAVSFAMSLFSLIRSLIA